MKRTIRTQKNKYFTLIELLVIVSIIGILLTILLPLIHKSREKAKATVCLSNQKQLGLGLTAFSADNNSFLPTNSVWNDNWQEKLYPSIINNVEVFACPSDDFKRTSGTKMSYGGLGWYVSSDNVNTWSDVFEAFGLRLTSPQFDHPSDSLILSEMHHAWKTMEGDMFQYPFQPTDSSFNHSVKQTTWFIDGHAEMLGVAEVSSKNYMFFEE